MGPRDWLLVFLLRDCGHSDTIDPLRIMKGLFLFAMSGKVPEQERYSFSPHLYGPFSKSIYDDLDDLEDEGYITRTSAPGKTWRFATLTPTGISSAERLLLAAPPEAMASLRESKKETMNKSFNDLLRYVYSLHPEYATNSVWAAERK